MKLKSNVLLMNGNVRDARRLHSITFTSLFFASSWMLNGPVMCSDFAIARAMARMRRSVSVYSFIDGSSSVASPECTPAFSMCSEIA